MVSVSSGVSVRRSTTPTSAPRASRAASDAASATSTIAPQVTTTASSPSRTTSRATEGNDVLAVGDVARRAVTRDRLEHEDRVVAADGAGEQPLGVRRVRRHDHGEPRSVRVGRLDRVGVQLGGAHTAAVGRAHGDRAVEAPAAAVAQPRELAHQLVVRLHREAAELDLGQGHQAGDREPDRRADDHRLGDRHVEHAVRAEPVERAVGGAEHATVRADVLTQEHDALVARHLVEDRLADRRQHGHARHETPSVARRRSLGCGRAPTISARCAAVRASAVAVTWSSALAGSTTRASAASMMRSSRASTAATRVGVAGVVPETGAFELGAEPLDRVARLPVAQLVVGDVARRVVGVGVRAHAVGDDLEQRRAVARGRAPHAPRARRRRTASTSLPSTRTPGMPAAAPLAAKVLRRGLVLGRGRDRPPVVDAHDEQRHLAAPRRG